MSDVVVHKLYPINVHEPTLLRTKILCWNNGVTVPVNIKPIDALVSTSINKVNCPYCLDLWHLGIYK